MKNKKLIIILCTVFLAVLLTIGGVILFFAVNDGKKAGRDGRSGIMNRLKSDSDVPDNEDDIRGQCPYDLSDGCEWSFYPSKNILGYAAFAREDVNGYKTDIFVFNRKRSEYIDVIENAEEFLVCANHGEFDPDETDISTQKDYCYVKLKYDSRIPLLYLHLWYNYESITVYPGDKPDLNYSKFSGNTFIDKSQSFNADKGQWDDMSESKDELEEPEAGIQYASWDELQVVSEGYVPCDLPCGASIVVWDYRYQDYDRYNIYDEIESPRHVNFNIGIYSNSDEGFASLEGYDLDITTAEVRLYKKSGSGYVDISPGDFVVDVYSEDEWTQFASISSTSLGELDEGYYRLEVGGYDLDFELKVQGFEAW